MSFAADCKQELCMIENKRACCLKAECYGLLLFSKCFSARESQMVCENAAVARRVAEAAAVSAGVYAEVRSQLRRKNIGAYAITIPGEAARIQMIRSFGHDENDVNLHIHEENLQKDCCISAFLRGVFLICGTVTDPQKEYHLEFSTPYLHLAEDLVAVLHRVKAAQLSPSIARRKNSYIVYIKESAAIEDFLTLTGAVNSAMNLMQIKMYKETYNNLNRVSNCETANLDKTYSAATKQIAAIALISDKVGLDELPADLREAAVLRLENPEMSRNSSARRRNPLRSRAFLKWRKSCMLKMQRPKSFKDLVLGILIVAVLGVGAYFIADALKAELVPGDIVVRSGNEEITALQNVTGEQRKNGSKACGGHFEIEEVADEFPVIRMDKGIVLEASQDPYGAMYYTVYNEDFSELYYRSERFAYPENDGTYYVVIDTAWGDKNHYFSTEHGFTLVIENNN